MLADVQTRPRLPRARLRAPQEPPGFAFPLVRTRLLEELARPEAVLPKLIAIIAPTGCGKTVTSSALYQFQQAQGRSSLWISLDDRDTTIERVIDRLEASLAPRPADAHPTQAMLRGDEPLENRIDDLLDAAARLPEPTTVFIDNLGYCSDETLGVLLDRLVFATPATLHLVFASTQELPMNLARAKLEGRVREVGYAELSLRREDVANLFGEALCARLGASAIDDVLQQTEGWPAAVRLAQIILAAAEEPQQALAKFSGADEDLAALLNRQVLAGFSPRLRAFLLAIAPLRSFCAELCAEATGDADAASRLRKLVKRNVFVMPLDRERRWYRMHGLFREFLIGEAERSLEADARRQLLERAANWCERGGHWQDAIDYALAAGSTQLAIATLERVAAVFVRDRGDLRQYTQWIETLHAAGHEVGWEADYWYVWALVFHRRYDRAAREIQRLVRRIEQAEASGDDVLRFAELKRRCEIIHTTIAIYTDRLEDASLYATRWLAARGSDDSFDVATVGCAAAIAMNGLHRFVEARQHIRLAQAAIAQASSAYGIGWVSLLAALPAISEGDFAAVQSELHTAHARARAALGEGSGICCTIALVSAKCAVEMGQDAEARSLVEQGLRGALLHGIVDTSAAGVDAALKLWGGRPDDPVSIPHLREIVGGYPERLGLMLSCLLVQRLVRLGRLEDALAEAALIGLGASGAERSALGLEALANPRAREAYAAAEIELLIANGKLRQADALIAEETRLAKQDGRVARLVELALAEMTTALCSHHPQPAARHFVRAVGLAARRRILRPFRDRAEAIAGLVNETKPSAWGFALDEERRFFFDICNGLPLTNAFLVEHLDQLQGENALLETPTARELQLLSLIEAGLSNQQLADRLNLSVATVKWHLYNLYTKLGVSSRSAALARARALNLLAR